MPKLGDFIGRNHQPTPGAIIRDVVRAVSGGADVRNLLPIPDALQELYKPARYKGYWSGRGASKSHSFASALLTLGMEHPLRVLCCREIQNSIRDSVKRLLDDKIESDPEVKRFYAGSTDTELRGANGTLFIFSGLRWNVDSIKSKEAIDIAWVEEAHSVSKSSIETLVPTIRKRGSEIWFSWNPRKKTDPVDDMFRGGEPPPNSIVRQVSWRDNPWFPEALRLEMEWDRKRDPEKYQHVWEGGYRTHTEAQVFRNWRIGSEEEFNPKPGTRFYYGGDWGFSIDPTVLIRSYVYGKTLYVDHEAWEIGCEIDYTPFLFGGCEDEELKKLNREAWNSPGMAKWKDCKGVPNARKWPIIADSARPETISYMKRHGFPKIEGARKGPGSLEEGVEFLKTYDVVVHPRCTHVIDELTHYSYQVDGITESVLPLLDKKNHTIDSLRYAVETLRRAEKKVFY